MLCPCVCSCYFLQFSYFCGALSGGREWSLWLTFFGVICIFYTFRCLNPVFRPRRDWREEVNGHHLLRHQIGFLMHIIANLVIEDEACMLQLFLWCIWEHLASVGVGALFSNIPAFPNALLNRNPQTLLATTRWETTICVSYAGGVRALGNFYHFGVHLPRNIFRANTLFSSKLVGVYFHSGNLSRTNIDSGYLLTTDRLWMALKHLIGQSHS